MDFFTRQDDSRRSSRRLVLLFGLAFLAVAIATATVVAIALNLVDTEAGLLSRPEGEWLPAGARIIVAVAAATMALMIIASLFRTATLSRGGGQVATMLGGTRIRGDDPDPLHQRLTNVVEEMAIASGLPVPEIYVLEQEAGINAFAAGLGHGDAAIAVTRGSLERLTRAELSGVVGHEFSHILNGDMRLNLRLMGFSFGILVLSLLGRWLLRGARFGYRSRNRGAAPIILIGIGLIVIGAIGVLLSRLIKAAVSRRREALADASAVQFTREPLALAGALKKIGGYTTYLTAVDAEEVSHMLFGRGSASFRGWFATHPPLAERIRALDPTFEEGDYPSAAEPLPEATGDVRAERAGAAGVAGAAGAAAGLTPAPPLDAVTAGAAGGMAAARTAAALREAIPESLDAAAHSTEQSLLLIAAIAMAADPASTRAQESLLEARLGRDRARLCLDLRRTLDGLDRRLWLPLVELTVPALRRRPQPEIHFLFDLLERLAALDNRQSLFEYVLARLLRAYLDHSIAPSADSLPSTPEAWFTLVATVAAVGHETDTDARSAFLAALPNLAPRERARATATFEAVLDDPGLDRLDPALDKLAQQSGEVRRKVLQSIETVIRHDDRIGVEEAELLRAIAAAMGCPIPPPPAVR